MPGSTPEAPLGVVIPTFDEGEWVGRAVDAVLRSAARAEWPLEVVVVDDGSTDARSLAVLDRLASRPDVRVVRQPNSGRFAARVRGLEEVGTDLVLLLDARVEIAESALGLLRTAVHRDGLEVWNLALGEGSRDPRALFWTGITKVWWRDYFRDPRDVSFGVDDFDRYPKGTGAFLAPRALLLEASSEFSSHFADTSLASDDTRLLREVARRRPINLSPRITFRHHVKHGWRPWARQAYYRGTTFVDGYLDDPRRAQRLLAVEAGAVLLAGVAALRAPRAAAAAALAGTAAAGTVARRCGATVPEAASVAALAPAFGPLFAAGVARGLRMAEGRG